MSGDNGEAPERLWSARTERVRTRARVLEDAAADLRAGAETFIGWALLFAGAAGLIGVRATDRRRQAHELQHQDMLRHEADQRARGAVKPVPMPAAANGITVELVDEPQPDG